MSNPKIAIVTGAARGLGLACARALAAEGAQIIAADVLYEEAVQALAEIGSGHTAIACDLSEEEQILDLFDRVERDFGAATILVNNAGVATGGDFLNYRRTDFEQLLRINLLAAFSATQRAARAMIDHGIKGSIINMSSINAVVAIPQVTAYCVSKGGINQLTKSAALALAPHGIRVNAVGPGSIMTEMFKGVNEKPGQLDIVMARTPLGRVGEPEEIGAVVAFLASDRASYITGETIYADGGRLGLHYTV